MSRAVLDIKALLAWIDEDPFREAILLDETQISNSTLQQLKSGAHKPSRLLANAIRLVMEKYPAGKPLPFRKAAVG